MNYRPDLVIATSLQNLSEISIEIKKKLIEIANTFHIVTKSSWVCGRQYHSLYKAGKTILENWKNEGPTVVVFTAVDLRGALRNRSNI